MTIMTLPTSPDRRIPLLVAIASLASLAVAFASQYWGGLQPCVLCIYQRYPYGVAAALGIIGMIVAGRPGLLRLILLLAAIAFLVDVGIAGFHVGVEQHWWAGTRECGSTLDLNNLSPEELTKRLLEQPLVPCDKPAWTMFGISMAGYNFVYAALCGLATLWFAARGRAAPA
jgi:disulfide bond formation protein DsbB